MKKYMFYLIAVAVMLTTACNNGDENGAIVLVTGVTIEQAELLISPGNNKILRAVVTPDNATNKSVTWSSSNETVATIDPVTGELAPLTIGSAVITVTTVDGGFSASRNIRVTNVPVTGIELSETEIMISLGDKTTLTATVLSVAATNKAVTWSSDNVAVAIINSTTGELSAEAVGVANITATTVENGFTASCKVIVVTEKVWNGFDITFGEYPDSFLDKGFDIKSIPKGQNIAGGMADNTFLLFDEYEFMFVTNIFREPDPFASKSDEYGDKEFEYAIQLRNNAPAETYIEFPELPNVGKLTVFGYCPNATNDVRLILQEKGVGNNVWNNVETGYLYSLTASGKDRMYVFEYSSNAPVTLRISRDAGTNFLGRVFRIVVEKY